VGHNHVQYQSPSSNGSQVITQKLNSLKLPSDLGNLRKKIAAPPGEQIKVQATPGVFLCDFEEIGLAVSEKKIF